MHAQESAKKDVFSLYEMTRYFRIFHVLIILSHLDSDANFLKNLHIQRKRSFHRTIREVSLIFNDFRKYLIK